MFKTDGQENIKVPVNLVRFNSLVKACCLVSTTLPEAVTILTHGLPHLLLATPNAEGVDPLPGKEASHGEERSSFGKAGRYEACHDLSPVTPLAHQASTLRPVLMASWLPLFLPRTRQVTCRRALASSSCVGARGFPWARGSRSELSSQLGCKSRLGQYHPYVDSLKLAFMQLPLHKPCGP